MPLLRKPSERGKFLRGDPSTRQPRLGRRMTEEDSAQRQKFGARSGGCLDLLQFLARHRTHLRADLLREARFAQMLPQRVVDQRLIVAPVRFAHQIAKVIHDVAIEANGDAHLLRWERNYWSALAFAQVIFAFHRRRLLCGRLRLGVARAWSISAAQRNLLLLEFSGPDRQSSATI